MQLLTALVLHVYLLRDYTYLAGGDCLATLARGQAAQHSEVLQQQQEASHCRFPSIQLASIESFWGGKHVRNELYLSCKTAFF